MAAKILNLQLKVKLVTLHSIVKLADLKNSERLISMRISLANSASSSRRMTRSFWKRWRKSTVLRWLNFYFVSNKSFSLLLQLKSGKEIYQECVLIQQSNEEKDFQNGSGPSDIHQSPISSKKKGLWNTSPKKSYRHMFSSVKETDEDTKNDSEYDSNVDSIWRLDLSESKPKVVGILALTQENLRKLDLK